MICFYSLLVLLTVVTVTVYACLAYKTLNRIPLKTHSVLKDGNRFVEHRKRSLAIIETSNTMHEFVWNVIERQSKFFFE